LLIGMADLRCTGRRVRGAENKTSKPDSSRGSLGPFSDHTALALFQQLDSVIGACLIMTIG
jgi:hypothetical protein